MLSFNIHARAGFTLVELLVVVGILATITTVTVPRLFTLQTSNALDASLTALVSDIKQQQIKAMVGDTQGKVALEPFGVYFETNRYTLFQGTTYTNGDPYNFVVNLEESLEFTNILLPQQQIIFSKGSGEVAGFTTGSDEFTLRHTSSGDQKTVRFNKYGVIVEAN